MAGLCEGDNDPPGSLKAIMVLAAIGTLFCVAMLLLCAWLLLFPTLPEWQRDDFTIESVPGLRYRPKPPDSLAKGTLITFNSERYEKWTSIIDDFIGRKII
ncbi:hypothetical protein ANN_05325 [Periplaneta americana]|uniref:Uncharacterized protein n=1 Tax=Periplaneta americana TaxID=6978 RepID=A0ABQ8TAT6_PERAM|nr:hypothetical protein ANN_05325 [Periplaneta americana]